MWIGIFPKKIYRWPKSTWKDAQHHQGNANQNHGELSPYNLEWLLSKSQVITHVGKWVPGREPSSTGRNVKWCSHYGKQCENSSESKNRTTVWSTSGYWSREDADAATMENSMEIPWKIKIELLYGQLLDIYPEKMRILAQEDTHPYIHCSIIYNRQDMEAACVYQCRNG